MGKAMVQLLKERTGADEYGAVHMRLEDDMCRSREYV